MLMMACRCGPRPQHFRGYIADAKRAARFDPTGTLDIRAAFRRQMDSRWAKLRRLAIEAIDRNDMLGLAGVTHRSIVIASQTINVEQIYPGSDKVKAFQSWIDAAMSQVILGDAFGLWTSNYIVRAAERATERAEQLTGGSFNNDPNRIRALSSLTVVELQGVMEAVSQQAVRAFTQGMLAKQRPSQVARSVSAVINAIGKVRGRMVAETMVVKTFTAVTADSFRAAGVTHIGTIPERIKAKAPIGDAARKTKQARGPGGQFRPYTKMPSAKKMREIIKREQELQKIELVEVLTAGDDDVCPICEDISDDGPYEIDEAEDLIPAHPWCRCALVPAFDERFAEVQKDSASDFNPYHKPGGSSEGGEFAEAPGIKAVGLDETKEVTKKWTDKSQITTAEDLKEVATDNQELLVGIGAEIAVEADTPMMNPGAKKLEGINKKLDRTPGRSPATITDATRLGYDAKTPEDAENIVKGFAKRFPIADEGWQETKAGYFDRKVLVRLPGQVGEVQIWPPGMLAAKEQGGGHKIFDVEDQWKAAQAIEKDGPAAIALQEEMKKLYGGVKSRFSPAWKGLITGKLKD